MDGVTHREPIAVQLSSGRFLSGTTRGPLNGRPVLFVAGAATGKTMGFGDDRLHERGIRLLTMDRPGMGSSTPDPKRTVFSTSDDYHAFVTAAVGDDRPVAVVANSQGSVFAMAMAQAGFASSLTLVSPADEVAHPDVHALLPPQTAALVDMIRDAPQEARKVFEAFTVDAMESMVVSTAGPGDRAFYTGEPFRTVYRTALKEGFANDGTGYVHDTLMAMSSWPVSLSRLRCPVRILFGEDDRTHSPDHGATLAKRMPSAEHKVVDGAGGALLWTHADLVLRCAV